jgi:deoxyribodipyrimidine photo-lyase
MARGNNPLRATLSNGAAQDKLQVMDTIILWLKRDLRVADHPALAIAAGRGAVLPVYIVEPDYWALPEHSGRQWGFIRESLTDLGAALAACGLPLVIRQGRAVDVLARLVAETGAREIVSHEETGGLWTYARDRAVAGWARGAGVTWHEVPQSGVIRRLQSRNGWAGLRDAYVGRAQVKPQGLRPPDMVAPSDPLPGTIGQDPCPARQRGGRTEGIRMLQSFLDGRGLGYQRAMSSPLTGAEVCSRLSPHLAFGTLSGREAAQAGAGNHRIRAGDAKSFTSRLAWRDHFMQKQEDEPNIEAHALHPFYDDLRPRDADTARLAAWAAGETGWPFVDACMRSLIMTGWLNFRMRSMLMAVASYHLWLDWRATGAILAARFTDYEPGIHWSQCQMQSGVTGINAIRVYNPIKQGLDQDADGVFTRRWLPELAAVPDIWLQRPWDWVGAGKLAYPTPMVDAGKAARTAKAAVWAVRSQPGFRDAAVTVVRRHASRKGSAGRFMRDKVAVPKPAADPKQGTFDFG